MAFWDDIAKGIVQVAPVLGTALGGPVGGIAARFAAKTIADVLGVDVSDEAALSTAVANITHDQALALKQADQGFKLRMKELEVDIYKVDAADRDSARKYHSGNDKVFWLGMSIYCLFALSAVIQLIGCYALLTGKITILDAGALAMVSNMLGNLTGYLASEAKQVSGFFFGSSSSSQAKDSTISSMANNK